MLVTTEQIKSAQNWTGDRLKIKYFSNNKRRDCARQYVNQNSGSKNVAPCIGCALTAKLLLTLVGNGRIITISNTHAVGGLRTVGKHLVHFAVGRR